MHTIMTIIKCVASVLATLLAIVLSPIIAYWEVTPKYLQWATTFDAPISEGANYYPKLSPYFQRLMWVLRNPAYSFNYHVLGIDFKQEDWTVEREESDSTEPGQYKTAGFSYLYAKLSGKFGGLYYQGYWGKYKIGYSVYNFRWRDNWIVPESWKGRMMWKFSLNPFWGLSLVYQRVMLKLKNTTVTK